MHKDRTIGQLICQKHADQLPTPWYKLNLVLEDETSEMNALIIGKSGEKLLGTTCRHLVRVYSHTLGAISKVYRGKAFSKTLHMQYSLTWNLLDFRLSESCDFVIIFHGISFVLVSSLSISLLNCMDDKRKYKGMHLAPTFEVPPMSRHPKTGD
ncbi:uncharacterized protein [Malus domestica]|uniref:uncharacterized protein isoform X2 n=2 Tax=Malus domestica TaxID=3750 RepID=UPI0010AADCB1|nr:uncharacterized protein LOC103417570 isoform X1 [Malus domestica]XP_028954550.1 uncharacterized protein LOC103417570 isoform X1 [Malus domestica]XP_028954551.1 uncharacterized protein LOC103417570 isoform X1 [Malus domestica]